MPAEPDWKGEPRETPNGGEKGLPGPLPLKLETSGGRSNLTAGTPRKRKRRENRIIPHYTEGKIEELCKNPTSQTKEQESPQ